MKVKVANCSRQALGVLRVMHSSARKVAAYERTGMVLPAEAAEDGIRSENAPWLPSMHHSTTLCENLVVVVVVRGGYLVQL